MIEELDRWDVKFEKDETDDYAVKRVHHVGTYLLPITRRENPASQQRRDAHK